jgi:hypothetical protein
VASLLRVMGGAGRSAAQQRADAQWTTGTSRDRCLLPLFSFLGQSAASCTIAPVPLHAAPAQEAAAPQVIISSSSTPGITVVSARKGRGRSALLSAATDIDGCPAQLLLCRWNRFCALHLRCSYYVTDGHMLLKDDGGVVIAAQTEVCRG